MLESGLIPSSQSPNFPVEDELLGSSRGAGDVAMTHGLARRTRWIPAPRSLTSSPTAGPIGREVAMRHLAPPTLTAAEQKAIL